MDRTMEKQFLDQVFYPKQLASSFLISIHHVVSFLACAYVADLLFNLHSISVLGFLYPFFTLRLWMAVFVSLILPIIYSNIVMGLILGQKICVETGGEYLLNLVLSYCHRAILVISDTLTTYILIAFFGPNLGTWAFFTVLQILALYAVFEVYCQKLSSWQSKALSLCYSSKDTTSEASFRSLVQEFINNFPQRAKVMGLFCGIAVVFSSIMQFVYGCSVMHCMYVFLELLHPCSIIVLSLSWLRSTVMLQSVESIIASVLRKKCEFCIPPPQMALSDPAKLYLTTALNSSTRIIKLSAFSDLSYLSGERAERRTEIYSVSLPGGHPRNWNAVFQSCCQVLDDLNSRLEVVLNSVHGSGQGLVSPVEKSWAKMQLQPPHLMATSAASNGADKNGATGATPVGDARSDGGKVSVKVGAYLNFKLEPNLVDRVFLDSQIVVFALNALGSLVCHSYVEDVHGVVQNDISHIVKLLLNIRTHVDTANKLGVWNVKTQGSNDLWQKVCIEQNLNEAIDKIGATFGKHIEYLKLDSYTKKTLMSMPTWN